ncbi:GNAT family N-acetyltransferase [Ideonella sp. A 288]|uniref:GNAT family N-acetyltransferase n=1 Tax=Ideonella sp. A 288 TaxID=1962181 RepID=UPI000B4B53B6|nr:GNAT family N-acetyltransferase [Ideonella sp. A 288]
MTGLAPVDFAPVEAAAAQARWGEVRQALQGLGQQLAAQAGASGAPADAALVRRLRAWQYRAAPFWWAPLAGGGVRLRRTEAGDAAFYRQCFEDREFARRYNRQASWSGDLERALARAGLQSPVELQAVHWIVCDRDDRRLGLASLTSLSLGNAKAEVSLGFTGPAAATHGVMAMLLVYHFAFALARLNKLYSYVYAANPEALHNSLRVGLLHEGTLKDHFFLPPGEFVDVHALGLTRAQLLANERIVAMARRRLGLEWQALVGVQVSGAAPH